MASFIIIFLLLFSEIQNCFETWKQEYFKTLTEVRMSQRSITAPTSPNNLPNQASLLSSTATTHARSSSLGDIRVTGVVPAVEVSFHLYSLLYPFPFAGLYDLLFGCLLSNSLSL